MNPRTVFFTRVSPLSLPLSLSHCHPECLSEDRVGLRKHARVKRRGEDKTEHVEFESSYDSCSHEIAEKT